MYEPMKTTTKNFITAFVFLALFSVAQNAFATTYPPVTTNAGVTGSITPTFALANPPVITNPGIPGGGVMQLPNGTIIQVPSISSPGVTANTRPNYVEILPAPKTTANTVNTTVARPQTAYAMTVRPVGTLSNNAMLTIVNRFENVCPRDVVDFTINYKNISGHTLANVVLQVTLAEQINFDRASAGTFNPGDHTLIVPIGVLGVNQEGIVYLSGIASGEVVKYDTIVTEAKLVFTTPTGAQDQVTAYAFNNGATCPNQNLAALAFLSGDFFPHSFLGWFLLIVLIMGIVYIARKMYKKDNSHGHAAHAHA